MTMAVAIPKHQILHHGNCTCASGGWVTDAHYAGYECCTCNEPLGFNTPIAVDEGRLIEHLSCQIARETDK